MYYTWMGSARIGLVHDSSLLGMSMGHPVGEVSCSVKELMTKNVLYIHGWVSHVSFLR